MIDCLLLAYYDAIVGLVTGVGVFYVPFFRPTVVDYHHYIVLTVSGLVLFLVGGPIAALFYAPLVHWIHGVAALTMVLGLYDPLENDLRRDAWADILLQEPVQVRTRAGSMGLQQLRLARLEAHRNRLMGYSVPPSYDGLSRCLPRIRRR